MSVILKTLIATFCLLICAVSIRSEIHTRFTDKSISGEEVHRKFINPSVTINRHKRKASLEENQLDTIQASSNLGTQEINRRKRVIIFRPLFVYRQQQIEKTRLRNSQENRADYGSHEHQQATQQHQQATQQHQQATQQHQQATQQSSDLGTQVHHHHHHHHHHHYPENTQQTYGSTFE